MKERKVLYVTRDVSYPGGTERFFFDLAVYVAQKLEYRVFTFDTDGTGKFDQEIHRQMSDKGITVIQTKGRGNLFWDPQRAKELQEVIKKYGIDIIHTALFNSDFITWMAKCGSAAVRQVVSQATDINQLQSICPEIGDQNCITSPPPFTFPRWYSTKFATFSVALEEDSKKWALRKEITDNDLEPLVSQATDGVFTVSRSQVPKWAQWQSNIHVTPCCSLGREDLEIIKKMISQKNDLRNLFEVDNAHRVFTTVTRLVPGKGLEILIQSFLQHLENHRDDILLIAGDGPSKRSLVELAKGNPNIQFLGHLERTKVFELLLASDVGVLLSESEGLPLSIQEMMGCSLPIIATNVGGIPELVTERNGVLVAPNNIVDTVRQLSRFSQMEESELTNLGAVSFQIIVREYIKETVFEKILSLYG